MVSEAVIKSLRGVEVIVPYQSRSHSSRQLANKLKEFHKICVVAPESQKVTTQPTGNMTQIPTRKRSEFKLFIEWLWPGFVGPESVIQFSGNICSWLKSQIWVIRSNKFNLPQHPTGNVFKFWDLSEQKLSLSKIEKVHFTLVTLKQVRFKRINKNIK